MSRARLFRLATQILTRKRVGMSGISPAGAQGSGSASPPSIGLTQLDSTTASIASGGTYTGGYKVLDVWAQSIMLVLSLPALAMVELDFSDDGTNITHVWRAWLGGTIAHTIQQRGKQVRLVITNPGVKTDGTTGNAMVPTVAKIYESAINAVFYTPFQYQIISNATITATVSFGFMKSPISYAAPNDFLSNPQVGWSQVAVGTVSGAGATCKLGKVGSPDGTNLSDTESASTGITAANTSEGQSLFLSSLYLFNAQVRLRLVVSGTTPSFGGYYATLMAWLSP